MIKTSLVVVILSIVALVNAQCSCQSKPPLDVKYEGKACECGRWPEHPIRMEVPKVTEHRDAHYDYGFTIERPQERPAEVKYTFDFHMEKPKPLPSASLATYGFGVDVPVQKYQEVPQRYSFDYQVQTPVVKSEPSALQGLVALVDKVVVDKQDGCMCNSYKPTVDLLQRCPKHGHLYQEGGALYPNPLRYNKQEYPDQQAPETSDRPKRNVAPAFPLKFRGLLPALRPNNEILKVEEENENRIEEILKKNFGEDPTKDIDELLRPKPLGLAKNVVGDLDKAPVIAGPVPLNSDFIEKIKPKLEEAKANFRERIVKIVNKARLDAIKAKHSIQKRDIESQENVMPDELLDESFDENFEPIWITDMSVEDTETESENTINAPSNANADGVTSTSERFRKHCERCGELAKKFPCPSCGTTPHDYPSEGLQGHAIPKQNAEQLQQPRYVYDQFGRQYVENKKSEQAADEATVGSYHNQAAYGELKHILSKNTEAMHDQNRRVGDDHLIQPMNFEHASDAIRFIMELTQRNGQQFNEDYYTNANSYQVGASPQNFHAKRSFKIVPLAEKDDGSVFVKISPVGKPKSNNEEKASYSEYFAEDKTKKIPKIVENKLVKPKTNFKKVSRNGKNYEILALNANGSEEGSVGSAEDMEILKYVYAVNQKGHTTNESKLPNTENAHMET